MSACHQIIAQSIAHGRRPDEGGVDLCVRVCMVHVSERVIRLVGQTGENNRDVERASPRIADRIAPVEDGCREYGSRDDREMCGFGVGICVYRGGEGEPCTIPDEMCVWEWESEGG